MGVTDVRKVARSLLTSWDERDPTTTIKLGNGRRVPRFVVTHGLAAHTHEVTAAALDLLDQDRDLAAMPLVRAAFESALTAHWVALTADGWAAFMNEEIRQRAAHVSTLAAAASQAFRDAASTLSYGDLARLDTTASARNFHSICWDLAPGGEDAYAVYRLLSHMSHASVMVVEQYVDEIDSSPGVALRVEPKRSDPAIWIWFLATSLVWAGRAVDYFDTKHQRRSELRAAARALGTPSELKLSERAVVREQGTSSDSAAR